MISRHTTYSMLLFLLSQCFLSAQDTGELFQDAGVLEDTAVTGRVVPYDTESPVRQPLSTSLLGREELTKKVARNLRDTALVIPNFSQTDTGLRSFGDVISLRGFTNTPFFGSSPVAIYVDDVPYGNVAAAPIGLYGFDNIEVLRGSQGTLLGAPSYAGAIRLTSPVPMNEWHGSLTGTYGNYDALGIKGTLSGALVPDQLLFRVAANYATRDGYLDNNTLGSHPDDQRHIGFSATIDWIPSNEWRFTFSAGYNEFDDGGPRLTSLASRNPFDTDANLGGEAYQENNHQALRVRYEGEDWEFVSISSRRDWKVDPYIFDLDFSAFPAADSTIMQEQEQWAQELRFQSTGDSEWAWTAGAYASLLESDGGTSRNFLVPVAPEQPPSVPVNTTTDYALEQESIALFGDLAYQGWDGWRVRAGLRLDHVDTEIDRAGVGLFGPAGFEIRENWVMLSPQVGIDRIINDTTTIFARTGLSHKPGGFSAFVDDPGLAEFDDERAWTAELGVRTTLWDNVKVNASVFYSDIRDYQVERSLLGTDYTVLNAEEASSYGAELEVRAELFPGFEITGSLGMVETELDEFDDPVSGLDYSGRDAPFVPEMDLSVGAEYRHASGLFARAEVVYQGRTYFDDANRFSENGYTLVNAAVGWENEHWQVMAFGRNLTDEDYYINISPDLRAGTPGEPVRYGVQCRHSF